MTAVAFDDPVSQDDDSANGAAPSAPQSAVVDMRRDEVEKFVKNGRPTGLLLRSIAAAKGMTAEGIALASGTALGLVQTVLSDVGTAGVKNGSIRRIAACLGADLSTMRFASGQVHVFDLRKVSRSAVRTTLRAVGLLARSAVVAELGVPKGLRARMSGMRYFVLQTEAFRAIVVSSRGRPFEICDIPSARWVRREHHLSVVPVENHELLKHVQDLSLTEVEFDEIFQGARALSWSDVIVAARFNGVAKSDLMGFIHMRAESLEAEASAKARLSESGRPFLHLVGSEARVVNGA